MTEKIIIKNGVLVTEHHAQFGDILLADGKIAATGDLRHEAADKVYDAEGCFVIPGGIDPHVHLALPSAAGPSSDDFENGTRAALAGGTTTVIDFVTPGRGEKLGTALAARRAEADGKVLADYALHMSIVDWRDSLPEEMAEAARLGAPSFKIYLAYKQAFGLDDATFVKVLDAAARGGHLVTAHCEHGDIIDFLREKFVAEGKTAPYWHPRSRPAAVEEEAVRRAIALAGTLEAALYIVHLSTAGGLEAAAAARADGQRLYVETCPQYLLLDDDCYDGDFKKTAKYVMSPPLRPHEHSHALWEGVAEGIVDVIATDHCPFSIKGQKDLGAADFTKIPNGASGIEERLKLLWAFGVAEGKLTPQQFVALTSTRAARIFGLYPQKGTLEIGADADVTVWDPAAMTKLSAKTQVSKCTESIYEGFELPGVPRFVFSRGRIAVDAGKVVASPGDGHYVARKLLLAKRG